MGHYYADFACDDCGKLICNCFLDKKQKEEDKKSDLLLNALDESEQNFINLLTDMCKSYSKLHYTSKHGYHFDKKYGHTTICDIINRKPFEFDK